MLKKLRNRIKRSHSGTEGKAVEKERGSNSSIFRHGKPANSGSPSVEPALTWSLSNDEETSQSEFLPSPQVRKIASYIFSEQDLMTNELNHMRQLAEKQREIAKLQEVHAELAQLLANKDEEIANAKEEIDFKDRELAEVYQELSEKDEELIETKMELEQTKNQLNTVSTVLMKCQREHHEKVSQVWPW